MTRRIHLTRASDVVIRGCQVRNVVNLERQTAGEQPPSQNATRVLLAEPTASFQPVLRAITDDDVWTSPLPEYLAERQKIDV